LIKIKKIPEGEYKSLTTRRKKMSRAKAGDVLSCEVCGLAVIVDEECGCATIDLICCEEPMVNMGPAKPKKLIAAAAPKKKAVVKKAKAAPKKSPVSKKKTVKKVAKKPVKKAVKKPVKKAVKKVIKKKAKKK
jgi:hypothetical protein